MGHKMALLAEVLRPKQLFERVIGARRAQGVHIIPIDTQAMREGDAQVARRLGAASMREVFKVLRSGGVVAMALDRDLIGNGEPLEFFGQPAPIPIGAVEIAIRAGAAIVPILLFRDRYRVHAVVLPGDPLLRPMRPGTPRCARLRRCCCASSRRRSASIPSSGMSSIPSGLQPGRDEDLPRLPVRLHAPGGRDRARAAPLGEAAGTRPRCHRTRAVEPRRRRSRHPRVRAHRPQRAGADQRIGRSHRAVLPPRAARSRVARREPFRRRALPRAARTVAADHSAAVSQRRERRHVPRDGPAQPRLLLRPAVPQAVLQPAPCRTWR